ncbi:MFS transporter [Ornithinimicrobium humiphilum]
MTGTREYPRTRAIREVQTRSPAHARARARPLERARLKRFSPRDMLHPQVLPVATFMLVMAVGYSGVLTYLNSYAADKGLETGASVFFLAYAVVLFVARIVLGPLQDRRGDNLVVYIAIVAFALSLGLLAVAGSDLVLVLAGGLMGLGFGTLMSALQTVAVTRVPRHRMGVAISTHYFMIDLGVGVGPVVLGLLLAQIGYAPMYGVLAAGLYDGVHGRRDRARRRSTVSDPLTAP